MSPSSENLLSRWAAAPGDAKAQEAYRQVQVALGKYKPLSDKTSDIYLQGSYRNRTHIRADSDVDVVAELQSSFYYEDKYLSEVEKSRFHQDYSTPAKYGFIDFKRDCYNALVNYFGSANVTSGNKCIKIKGNSNRSDADVLACEQYRLYTRYSGYSSPYLSGIKFWTKNDKLIINWPKVHYSNGVVKNDATDSKFKGLVRVFKHIRNLLQETGFIGENAAPSYYMECLLFNVPDNYFANTFSGSLDGALRFLQSSDLSSFVCVNKIDNLFAANIGWNFDDAKLLIQGASIVNQKATA